MGVGAEPSQGPPHPVTQESGAGECDVRARAPGMWRSAWSPGEGARFGCLGRSTALPIPAGSESQAARFSFRMTSLKTCKVAEDARWDWGWGAGRAEEGTAPGALGA